MMGYVFFFFQAEDGIRDADVTGVQTCALPIFDRDKFSTADFEPAVINYYKFQDKLQSMPFNSSSAILYYNKDAFKDAGLDPEKAPVTFTEVADAAKKLTKKDSGGATVR